MFFNNHKNFHKRDGITNTRASSRERSSTNTRTSTRGMISQTQELPQERGLHHKHKSFSKNTMINPRRAPPTQARTIEEISTKMRDQEQTLGVKPRKRLQNCEPHEARLAHTRHDTNEDWRLLL